MIFKGDHVQDMLHMNIFLESKILKLDSKTTNEGIPAFVKFSNYASR